MGWVMEVTLQLVQKHKFSNRGFLIGPYCPIYGCGGVLITLTLSNLSNHPIALFSTAILSVILLSVGEILERLEILEINIRDMECKVQSIDSKNSEDENILYNNSWKCPKCGRVNNSYTGTCACGYCK